MASVTLELPEETRRRLEEKAARTGQALEVYIRRVLEAEAGGANGVPHSGEGPPKTKSVEEFDRWLAELKSLPPIPPPVVPCDWTREDIYFDHD